MATTDLLDTKFGLGINQLVELAIDTHLGIQLYRTRVEHLGPDRIVVALPVESPELLNATTGLKLGLIRKSEKGIYILSVLVIDRALTPIPLLSLRPDREKDLIQRRKDVRLIGGAEDMQAVLVEGQTQPIAITVLNISGGGLLFRSEHRRPLGSRLRIRLRLTGHPGPLESEAEVRRVVPGRDGGSPSYYFGTRFLGLEPGKKDEIVRFIFRNQAKSRSRGH